MSREPAVVRINGVTDGRDTQTILVGVDGSEESKAGLRWALDEAKRRDACVRAVYVWQVPYLVGNVFAPPAVPDLGALRRDAEQMLGAVVSEATAGRTDVDQAVVEGFAAQTLIEESRGADLLVVGSRGLGGFSELLLGSVGHKCAQHAHCPVVIVRGPAR
jgi:nucleotide-binding universal stress UspA family protein